MLGFLNDDPRQAVILGMLHSSAKPAPLQGSDDNHEKVYQSRSKMKIYFNDDTKIMRLETPAGNSITLSEDDQAIKIVDQNGNKMEMTQDGITMESSKAINLKAGTELKLESGTALGVKGGTELKLEGAPGQRFPAAAWPRSRACWCRSIERKRAGESADAGSSACRRCQQSRWNNCRAGRGDRADRRHAGGRGWRHPCLLATPQRPSADGQPISGRQHVRC